MEYHKSCEYEKCYISPPLFHSVVVQNIRVYTCIATRVLRTSRSIHGAVRKFLFLYGSICAPHVDTLQSRKCAKNRIAAFDKEKKE